MDYALVDREDELQAAIADDDAARPEPVQHGSSAPRPPGATSLGELCPDSRKSGIEIALACWRHANTAAGASETLLSRVLGDYLGGRGPAAAPDVVAVAIEARAHAGECFYDVLRLCR